MREVIVDVESTGFDPGEGHRVVEMGCVELLDHAPTGRTFHVYLDPERPMPPEAFKVHGLSSGFLKGKPVFADVADSFLEFIGDAPLIAHNAEFDRRFINAEFSRIEYPQIDRERVIDTLAIARQRIPGARLTLDAICKRYGISLKGRDKHGALLDAQLLAEVYPELIGANDCALDFGESRKEVVFFGQGPKIRSVPLLIRITAEDLAMHVAFIAAKIKKPIWRDYR